MAINRRIFVSFAVEDSWARDFLRGQSLNDHCPFDFVDMSVKEPWNSSWKTNCRAKIRGSDGFIAMLSNNTANASGARWEISCAVEEHIPVLGLFIHAEQRYVPPEMGWNRVIAWTWPGVAAFINGL